MLEDKIKEAEQTLRLAAEMSKYYYHKPLIICYSGGKDSDVLLDLAKRCLKPDQFEVLNSHTTVDAPETVYHIRHVFAECEKLGIKTEIKMPRYHDQPTSMWRIIEQHGVPNRRNRLCCKYLKETTTPKRMAALGIREDESRARQGREAFAARANKDSYRTTPHTYAMFKLDQLGKHDAYECQIIKACKKNKDTIANPIYKFTNADVWEYVEKYAVPMNPLYARGYKRVGCIGCPLASVKNMRQQFAEYPQYKKNYLLAFERMIKRRKENGKKCPWDTAEEVMAWWLEENPKQMKFEDLETYAESEAEI